MTQFKKVAEEFEGFIVYKTRDDGTTYYSLLYPRPQLMYDAVRESHSGMPDDKTYQVVAEAVEAFTECEDEDEARDRMGEIEADVYDSELTDWLGQGNMHWLDEARDEMGATGSRPIAAAQYLWKQEGASSILQSIVDVAGDREDEAK